VTKVEEGEKEVAFVRQTPATGIKYSNSAYVNQTNHFFNLGYGWMCKHCSAADTEARQHASLHANNSHRQESGPLDHERSPKADKSQAHDLPLARWTDASHHSLKCPRCSIEEIVSKA
jgi:hypothetical protein